MVGHGHLHSERTRVRIRLDDLNPAPPRERHLIQHGPQPLDLFVRHVISRV